MRAGESLLGSEVETNVWPRAPGPAVLSSPVQLYFSPNWLTCRFLQLSLATLNVAQIGTRGRDSRRRTTRISLGFRSPETPIRATRISADVDHVYGHQFE